MLPSTAHLLAALHDDAMDSDVALRPPGTAIITRLPTRDENDVALPLPFTSLPSLRFLTIAGDSSSWTQDVIDTILRWLPGQVQVYTREVTDDQRSAQVKLTTRFLRGDKFFISSLTIPLDQIDVEIATYALQLPALAEIVLRAHSTRNTSHTVTDVALRFLQSFGSLVVAIFTISSEKDIVYVLDALQHKHPGLTRLAVLTAPGCNLLSATGSARIRLENTIIRGLEGFTQLEHLVLDEGLMCPLLDEALGRLHRLKYVNYLAGPFPIASETEVSRVLRSTLLESALGFPN